MKKVYTLTFHNANNYGAVIQAYALQKVLLNNYETCILNYNNKYISQGYKLFKCFNNGFNIKQFFKDILNLKKEIVRNANFDKFRRSLYLSEEINNIDLLSKLNSSAYVVGSDQIWNPDMTNGVDDFYTLNVKLKNCKKISYAASSGNKDVLVKNGNKYFSLINDFDSVSVREKGMKEIIESKTEKKVDVVLDPSLLLSFYDWSKFCGNDRIIKEKYIFVYCGDEPEYFYDIVNDYAKINDCTIIYFGRRDLKNKFKYRKKSMYEVGPVEFVNLIKYSDCVFTASFHGTALGIVLNKKILLVLNKYQDRLSSLIDKLGLNERIASNFEEYKRIIDKDIDWENVNKLLEVERSKSIEWLYKSIDG